MRSHDFRPACTPSELEELLKAPSKNKGCSPTLRQLLRRLGSSSGLINLLQQLPRIREHSTTSKFGSFVLTRVHLLRPSAQKYKAVCEDLDKRWSSAEEAIRQLAGEIDLGPSLCKAAEERSKKKRRK